MISSLVGWGTLEGVNFLLHHCGTPQEGVSTSPCKRKRKSYTNCHRMLGQTLQSTPPYLFPFPLLTESQFCLEQLWTWPQAMHHGWFYLEYPATHFFSASPTARVDPLDSFWPMSLSRNRLEAEGLFSESIRFPDKRGQTQLQQHQPQAPVFLPWTLSWCVITSMAISQWKWSARRQKQYTKNDGVDKQKTLGLGNPITGCLPKEKEIIASERHLHSCIYHNTKRYSGLL